MPAVPGGEATVLWEHAGSVVERLFGLHLQGERLPDLKRSLRGAASELGLSDAEACARLLVSEKLDDAGVEILASHLTIGETYFFRDQEAFAALSAHVLSELIEQRRRTGNRQLRIWSAACCTGEETYSIAIQLQQLLPDIANWQINLLGTDVNPRFLRTAAEGVYGQWSFRGTSPDFRARHFRQLAGGRYVLSPTIRRIAHFASLNLADEAALAGMRDGDFDLVLCRNVLMYFTSAQASKVVEALHGSLREEGWLAVAPCEASQTLFAGFRALHCDGAILYRKGPAPDRHGSAPKDAGIPAAMPVRTHPAGTRAAHEASLRFPKPVTPLPAPRRATPPAKAQEAALPVKAIAARARALADQRRMDEALACCDRWIAAEKLDPAAHCLRGMILAETGNMPEASAAFERSLYLAPDGVMAGLALANLERTRGREKHAARHYRNILALLERLPPDADLEHAEGISVRQLTSLVRDLMVAGDHT
ncbi:protein-glutamate O-methyltransferase CheR [Rhodanobacter sp. DHB23]|uniref:CheR family methyltransferase n=1 Tax=Rhodanobacter sp. DHB23 TaxID=2775923 RepID=UPI00177FD7E2|nr:protein-glutamate O-methyltransferase CheR [Rhodanobacter sp. DHB23]MBD8873610.1 chemotaxis protein CheR [Rhodanobacter sp. DHB23]